MLDCTYRVQIPHRPGQLARVAGAIAEGDGVIGDVATISVGREHSIREITVEVRDDGQAARIEQLLDMIEGVRVVWYRARLWPVPARAVVT
jgi:malate dehydrogenase (oxaloacetate-decarboxylating)